MQQLAVSILFHCKITVNISGALCTHHQEYVQLQMQPLLQDMLKNTVLCIPDDGCKEHPKHVE
jgi:hypothetical protein